MNDIRGLEYRQCEGEVIYMNGRIHRCPNEAASDSEFCRECEPVEDLPDDCPDEQHECYDCPHFDGDVCVLAG